MDKAWLVPIPVVCAGDRIIITRMNFIMIIIKGIIDHQRSGVICNFDRVSVCMSVCLSVDNFRTPCIRRQFIFAHPVYLQRTRAKFVYEGHRVKVKVTGEKDRKFIFPQCKVSIGHNSASIKYRAIRFACDSTES